MNDTRGSIWRRWDLHLHTPASGSDYGDATVTNQDIVNELVKAGVAAVAITDHNVIDVERIRELQQLGAGKITFFPGIEFRCELGGQAKIHFIGIFPEDCDVADVWERIGVKLSITDKDRARIGEERVYVPFVDGTKVIKSLGGLVSIHAGHKSNTIENISNAHKFKQQVKTDMLRDCVDILEVSKVSDVDEYRKIVFPAIGKRMPIIVCSDNHAIREYAAKIPCWIKADPTFHGLRHLLREPDERVHVGELPPVMERVSKNKTRYIRSIEIAKKADAKLVEHWFNHKLRLNHGLVAVIGNKGSGKSAIADIIALLGDTENEKHFSFLTRERFRKGNKAEHFEATITWESGGTFTRHLGESVESGTPESVRYLPQAYLERLCNDIGQEGGSRFSQELKAVIFTHVDAAERLGYGTLDELLDYKTEEIGRTITLLKGELSELVTEVVELEERNTPAYKKLAQQQLEAKNRELAAHELSKPPDVQKPVNDGPREQETTAAEARIKELLQQIEKNVADQAKMSNERTRHLKRVEAADRLKKRLANLRAVFNKFQTDSKDDCVDLDLDVAKVATLTFDEITIDKERTASFNKAEELAAALAPDSDTSPLTLQAQAQASIDAIRANLDRPNQIYQKYLADLKSWTDTRLEIIGDETIAGSVKQLERQMQSLSELPAVLQAAKQLCIDKSKEIYSQIQTLADAYKTLYEPVQRFIQRHPLAREHFRLTFETAISPAGFVDGLLANINQARVGSFCGATEGQSKAASLCQSADFNNSEGVEAFLQHVLKCLEVDTRGEKNKPVALADQLATGCTATHVYDFIFSLDYLRPTYTLQWAAKDIAQLSPGERGTLLLVFYLLIDRSEIPLVMDQPEENLDNQTVYDVLVPSLKEAKARRQIILVTHNPNLAVVCDADQVIYCSLDKNDGHRIGYEIGAIENPSINKHVIDILEGTWPAFDNRGSKYHPIEMATGSVSQ